MKQKPLTEAWDHVYYKNSVMGLYDDDQIVTDFTKIVKHDQTPITLGDYIACDKDGKPLEKPEPLGYHEDIDQYEWDENQVKEYQQALDRVVYKGWALKWTKDDEYTLIKDGIDVGYVEGDYVELNDKEIKTRGDMVGLELTDNYAKKLYG